MATPAIENIINYYNDIEITFIGSNVSIEALKNHPKVAEVIVLDKKYKSLYKIYNRLGVFDVYFTFRSSFRAKLLRLFVKSMFTVVSSLGVYMAISSYIWGLTECTSATLVILI